MKKSISLLVAVLLTATFCAQSPAKMSYQAVIRDANNACVASQAISMKISILQGSAFSSAVYVETHTPTTNSNGLVSVEIGGGTVESGTFADINWASGPYFIKSETDLSGGTNYTITGTSQLLSVPYALYSATAGSISNYAISQLAPVVTEEAPTNIAPYSATLNSTINGKGFLTTVTFEYGTTAAYGNNVAATQSQVTGGSEQTVSANITGLQPGTVYHYRVKAANAVNVTNSADLAFATTATTAQLSTTAASSILALTASAGGNITSDGGSPILARGVCWSTSTEPTIALSTKTTNDTGTGTFTSNLIGLLAGTKYYIRAYATNAIGTAYGEELSFTTATGIITISTNSVSSIAAFTATGNGWISSDGGDAITERGICWSTTTGPTIALTTKASASTTNSSFSANITGLTPSTKYYVRAYATNSVGTSYGSEVSFTTTNGAIWIQTTSPTSITTTTATAGGTVGSDGGAPVTARGVCWIAGSSLPTIELTTKTVDGSGGGTFTSYLTGLTPGVVYNMRAYATNAVGTSYGPSYWVRVQSGVIVFSGTYLSNIAGTSVSIKQYIALDNGSPITAKGLCWSTSPSPTVALSTKTSNGTGTDYFTANITGLTANTVYYVRAYATNEIGTQYSNEVSFNSGTLMGTSLGGGLVFYNDGAGHGLVCAPTDQSTGVYWTTLTAGLALCSADGYNIGTGNANTTKIVTTIGAGTYPAKLCSDLVIGTYSDWYLPTRWELKEMYNGLKASGLGGFANAKYWSSSEYDSQFADYWDFGTGDYGTSYKYSQYYVRAIRAF